jgi:hypothetical protein
MNDALPCPMMVTPFVASFDFSAEIGVPGERLRLWSLAPMSKVSNVVLAHSRTTMSITKWLQTE